MNLPQILLDPNQKLYSESLLTLLVSVLHRIFRTDPTKLFDIDMKVLNSVHSQCF